MFLKQIKLMRKLVFIQKYMHYAHVPLKRYIDINNILQIFLKNNIILQFLFKRNMW
jgi:hypothetical protein